MDTLTAIGIVLMAIGLYLVVALAYFWKKEKHSLLEEADDAYFDREGWYED